MLRRILASVVLLLVVGACTSEEDRPPQPTEAPESRGFCDGPSSQTLTVEGTERMHLAHVPRDVGSGERLPVVYFFHGLGGQADTALAYTELAERADEHGFIVIAPQAIQSGSSWDYRSSIDDPTSDLAYVRELMDAVAGQDCVDPDRQYASGLSNGSAMTFALACSGELPLRGYAGVAAAFYDESCDDAPPASILYFHGTADPVVPFNGGPTPIEPVRPAPETLIRWAEHAGCESVADEQAVGNDVELYEWPGCADHPVEAYVILEGGHTWPGAGDIPGIGAVTDTVDASDLIVDFFGLDA
ncbi:alpha/beta hydrolase family esterase [Aeromicrobium sp. CF4.19]|uniref:alpha/beta hydrolase family esterase n=1 Tax=Aeromicrobium sp. CF4.19 TaxID=3373082 RepID=UPI003EE74E7A